MRHLMAITAALVLVASASANLYNADMEYQPGAMFSTAEGWRVTGGGWADHAGFPAPNNGTLGLNFIFYSNNTAEIMGQVSTLVFEPEMDYAFTSWLVGGGGEDVTVPYQIGYLSGGDSIADNFVELAVNLCVASGKGAGGAWSEMAGVSYTTGTAGDELGLPVVVRFGNVDNGGAGGGGSWIDNASLTPEPASLLLLCLGALALRRR